MFTPSLLIILVFLKSFVSFTIKKTVYSMPLTLFFFLIGFFIWTAENITTFFGAWVIQIRTLGNCPYRKNQLMAAAGDCQFYDCGSVEEHKRIQSTA
ncbi:DUF817 domain-containing protein [Bacillus sp. CMF21]|uniref:DUF817 family protein n=1 Tax=Metabacillus dongyingensis TaxID=2874282 RepID=UPI001CBFF493|nr:DUF817 domain-containing protein [Bacillus sp. CMF21]